VKVTDAMIERAMRGLHDFYGHTTLTPKATRAALEAALADVPEPTLAYSGLLRDYRDRQVDIASLHEALAAERQRIAALEAKLKRVRAWREEWGPAGYDELDAILDTEGA
jgi:predicted RNase H-like nuclease (RuvC/YqgF family)